MLPGVAAPEISRSWDATVVRSLLPRPHSAPSYVAAGKSDVPRDGLQTGQQAAVEKQGGHLLLNLEDSTPPICSAAACGSCRSWRGRRLGLPGAERWGLWRTRHRGSCRAPGDRWPGGSAAGRRHSRCRMGPGGPPTRGLVCCGGDGRRSCVPSSNKEEGANHADRQTGRLGVPG